MSKNRVHRWGKWEYTDSELERQHKEAVKRGKIAEASQPQAKAARYDRKSKRLVIELANGATFMIPISLLQGLEGAGPRDISAVEVRPHGSALHWETLDLDFGVAGLVAGWVCNKAGVSEVGRTG